jgi:hypothetical protein
MLEESGLSKWYIEHIKSTYFLILIVKTKLIANFIKKISTVTVLFFLLFPYQTHAPPFFVFFFFFIYWFIFYFFFLLNFPVFSFYILVSVFCRCVYQTRNGLFSSHKVVVSTCSLVFGDTLSFLSHQVCT